MIEVLAMKLVPWVYIMSSMLMCLTLFHRDFSSNKVVNVTFEVTITSVLLVTK